MVNRPPYLVAVTTPSAGVGKSTLAQNLAVYLKGLAEDLPVAYVAGDSDDSEEMFTLAGDAGGMLTDLLLGQSLTAVLGFGEFGVEHCRLGAEVADMSPAWLRRKMAEADFDGVIIIDLPCAHPLLSAVLWAADLVLAPVKDPAALGALVAMRKQFLESGGSKELIWLLPSELGESGSYRQQAEVVDFLRFAAEERGFEVCGETFVADEQARANAVGRAKPVLTRAGQSRLHQQLRQIAELLLSQREQGKSNHVRVQRWQEDGCLPARSKIVNLVCPLCRHAVIGSNVHYLESIPARKRLLIHQRCLADLLTGTEAELFLPTAEIAVIQQAVACGGVCGDLRLSVLDAELEKLCSEFLSATTSERWEPLLRQATHRHPAELYGDFLLLSPCVSFVEALSAEWYKGFVSSRRSLRKALAEEKI